MSSFTWYRDKDGKTIRCLETGVVYVKVDPHWDIVPLDPDDDDNVVEGEDIPHVWNLLESLCEKEVGNDPAQETASPREYRYFRFRLEESEKARQQALRSNAEMMEDLDQAKSELDSVKRERDTAGRIRDKALRECLRHSQEKATLREQYNLERQNHEHTKKALYQAKQQLAVLKKERDNLARDVEMLGLADNEYIRWHPYPEVVPAACLGPITMLVTMKLGVCPAVWHPRREVFLKYRPRGPEEELVGVISWAHLPAGYNPKEDKDNE